jgi:hypothetical protein
MQSVVSMMKPFAPVGAYEHREAAIGCAAVVKRVPTLGVGTISDPK